MKLNTRLYQASAAVVLAATVLSGCNDAEYSPISTRAYIEEAVKEMGTKITVPESGATAQLTARISTRATEDCAFKLVVDTLALVNYNKANGTNYAFLPQESYTLPESIVIKANEYQSEKLNIGFKKFTEEMQISGESYALPLRLVNTDGHVATTAQSSSFVIATDNAFTFAAPVLTGSNPVQVDMTPGAITVNEFTVELRFQIAGFYENQAFFDGGGSGNDQVYIRLEDPCVPGGYNLIQIVGKGTYLNALTPFEKNKWQHLAISFNGSKYSIYVNGKLDAQKEVAAGTVTFSNIKFICSGVNWFKANSLISEVRLWDKALSESQIRSNQVKVNPKAPGLRAYWKMNEGQGKVFKDATGNGYDATCANEPAWIGDIQSTDEKTIW